MIPASRTPEGSSGRCPVCGKLARIEPSQPPGDAPCPHCGHLLWFEPGEFCFTLETFRELAVDPTAAQRHLPELEHMQSLSSHVDQSAVRQMIGMIDAMTPEERKFPEEITSARLRRIARGSGHSETNVRGVVRGFLGLRQMVFKIRQIADK